MQNTAWRHGLSRNLLALLLVLFGCSGDLTADSAQSEKTLPREWRGAWQQQSGSVVLNIEPDRIVESNGKSLTVRRLVRRERDRVILWKLCSQETWKVARIGADLRLEDEEGTVKSYRPLGEIPPQVRLEPLPLPIARPLRPERVQAIQVQIERRYHKEQEFLSDPARRGKFRRIQRANLRYLRRLLGDVGWIDRNRFGDKTSVQAALIAKHTEDLRLMMTVLEHAEADFQRAGKGKTYAILYDAVQLDLGRKQRYGTQVCEDATGPFILPLEDPKRVDDYLTRIGLPTLAEYQTQIGRALYEGKVVRVRQEDGPQ